MEQEPIAGTKRDKRWVDDSRERRPPLVLGLRALYNMAGTGLFADGLLPGLALLLGALAGASHSLAVGGGRG